VSQKHHLHMGPIRDGSGVTRFLKYNKQIKKERGALCIYWDMLLNVQLQICHSTLKQVVQSVQREELLHWILSTARSINNAAVLCKVTSSLVIWVRKCIQADGGHFEQLVWVLNGKSVTVHLATYLNKCTKLLFPF